MSLLINRFMKAYEFRVGAAVACTATDEGLHLDHVDVFHKNQESPDPWKDAKGHYTPAGVDMLLFGFGMALVGVIHAAEQQSGMDPAALLRQAIAMMEKLFVTQVSATEVHSAK